MFRCRLKIFVSLYALLWLICFALDCHAIQKEDRKNILKESELANQTDSIGLSNKWILEDPQIYDLGIDPVLFKNHFQKTPPHQVPKELLDSFINIGSCHTQGMEIVNDTIIISCCFYDFKNKKLRTHVGDSLLLSARLSDVLNNQEGHFIDWKIKTITSFVPPKEALRINELLRRIKGEEFWADLEEYRLKLFPNTLYEQKPLRPILSHPSGLIKDNRGYVWNANSVYGGPNTFASIEAYNPQALVKDKTAKSMTVPNHIGWLALFQNRFLIGETWGGFFMVVFDIKTGKHRIIENSYRNISRQMEKVSLGDCAQIDETYSICAGNRSRNHLQLWFEKGVRKGQGKLYLVKGEGSSLEDFKFSVLHSLLIQLNKKQHRKLTTNFGKREFRYKKGIGDIEGNYNYYGDYESPLTLTNNAITLSPDKDSIYFLPEDIPGGKLIRYYFRKND